MKPLSMSLPIFIEKPLTFQIMQNNYVLDNVCMYMYVAHYGMSMHLFMHLYIRLAVRCVAGVYTLGMMLRCLQ